MVAFVNFRNTEWNMTHTWAHSPSTHPSSGRAPSTPVNISLIAFLTMAAFAVTVFGSSHASGESQNRSVADIVERVLPAVVSLHVIGEEIDAITIDDPSPQAIADAISRAKPEGFLRGGSGVIIDGAKGYILTNAHVVTHALSIDVVLADGHILKGESLGEAPGSDVAVVKVDASSLPYLVYGDSDALRVGDSIIAVGSPFGLEGTVTAGIVSALRRSDLGYGIFEDFIQIDAVVNPGNSGGPLINSDGSLVGINTVVGERAGSRTGIGFAIPINMARDLAQQIVQSGRVKYGALGLQTQLITPRVRELLHLSSNRGALIDRVLPGSPASLAGVKSGDVIISIDGTPIRRPMDYVSRVVTKPIGTRLTIEFATDSGHHSLVLETASLIDATPRFEVDSTAENVGGLVVGEVLPGNPQFGMVQGAQVLDIRPDSKAQRLGLEPGDIVVQIGDRKLRSCSDLVEYFQGHGPVHEIRIKRQGLEIRLSLAKKKPAS